MKKTTVVHRTTVVFFIMSRHQPRIFASMALPVGVSARPPSGDAALEARQRHIRRTDGVDGADDIALDAGDLHQTCHRVADQAQQILQGHGHSVADLLAAAAPEGHQSPRRHGTGGADLRLTAAGSTGDAGPIGDDGADTAGYIQCL